jgi:hypothetical protein
MIPAASHAFALVLAVALDCRLADARVEAAIARKAASLKADEYCQFRHYEAMSDLDGDGKNDLVVLFNVEPREGNDHLGFLAVFLSSDPAGAEPLMAATGGRGERDAVSIDVKGRRIELGTLEYEPSDPMCCPSGKGTLVFELKDRALAPVKVKKSAKRR